jgi:hypothetical protein
MWFIIRTVFCVGLVFSMTPGEEVIDDAGKAPAALATVAAPTMRDLVDGALSACRNDPKLCLEATRRFAGLRTSGAVQSSRTRTPNGVRLVADTLTVTDRAAPWRGASKEPRGSTHARAASPPAT